MTQNDKKFCLYSLISEKPYIIRSSFMVQMCKRIISPILFIHFFQILVFGVNSGVKGQKMVQNGKNLCLLYSISQETFIIWSWVLVHICKTTISPEIFFNFSKFWFFRYLEGCNDKKLPIITYFSRSHYIKNCRSHHQDFWYTGVKWWYLQVFFFLFFFKYNTVNTKFLVCFLAHLNSCFSK